MGLPRHLCCAGDEVAGAFAQPPGAPVLDHLLPAAPLVHNQHAAARHGFKADARPVLRRVRRLQHDVAAAVELLLGERFLVVEALHPVGGLAGFSRATGVEAKEGSAFGYGGGEVFVDAPRILAELVFVLPGDMPGSEPVGRPVGDVRKGGGVEVRAEGDEADGRIVVDGSEAGRHALPDLVVLVEEQSDVSPAHGFLLLAEEPGHAVHKDGPARPSANLGQRGEEVFIAEADDGRVFRNGSPVVGVVDHVAALRHLAIERGLPDVFLGGDKVEHHPQRFPSSDLMIQLRSRPAIEGRKTDDVENRHS